MGILSDLAQYERAQIRVKQASGIKSAKARGKRLGKPSELTEAQRAHAKTSPTGPTGSFVSETGSIPGIGWFSGIRVSGARLFFQSFPWTGPLPVTRGTL